MIHGYAIDRVVMHDDKPLDLGRSLRLWNHSQDGFAWGYLGSGPAQLALALLLEFTDAATATALHQQFKMEKLAPLDGNQDFHWTDRVVQDWLAAHPALIPPTAPCPLDAGTLWLWLDHVIRVYGADVPVCIDWHGTPAFVGEVKLKTNGTNTHVVVFVPAPEGE